MGPHVGKVNRDRILFVGWQERLDTDFAALVGLLGLPPSTGLPIDAHSTNRNESEPGRRALTPDAADNIRAWYADDYRLIDLLAELRLVN